MQSSLLEKLSAFQQRVQDAVGLQRSDEVFNRLVADLTLGGFDDAELTDAFIQQRLEMQDAAQARNVGASRG